MKYVLGNPAACLVAVMVRFGCRLVEALDIGGMELASEGDLFPRVAE